jgi:large subunit ribosomal protein L13
MNRTYSPRASEIERSWFVVDATGQRLGTLASRVAQVLAGKHKPTYATHIDMGDHVIVLNAARIDIGGAKTEQKIYSRHSGYPGGLRQETLGHLLERRPEEVIRRAVKGMLPRTRLGAQQLRKLKIYAGGEHPHEAQVPVPLPGSKATEQETLMTEAKPTDEVNAAPETQAAADATAAEESVETEPAATHDTAAEAAEGPTEDEPQAETKTGGSDE